MRHLHDRLDKLQDTLASCQESLEAQREAAETLRLKVARLRSESAELTRRADAAHQEFSRRMAAPAVVQHAAPVPGRRRHGGMKILPYIVLVAVGLGYGMRGSQAALAPQYRPLPAPSLLAAPASTPEEKAASAALPAEAEEGDDQSSEALRLVYESKAPGSQSSILELLGASEAPGRSPWEVDRFDESGYVVTYRTPDGAAAYEFETDISAGSVTPTPETTERLTSLVTAR